MDKPRYFAMLETKPCAHCGEGAMWGVFDRQSEAFALGTFWSEEVAVAIAEAVEGAYRDGLRAGHSSIAEALNSGDGSYHP